MKVEYVRLYLSQIIRFYKENALKHDDWETVAVDPVKDTAVFVRYSELNEGEEDE